MENCKCRHSKDEHSKDEYTKDIYYCEMPGCGCKKFRPVDRVEDGDENKGMAKLNELKKEYSEWCKRQLDDNIIPFDEWIVEHEKEEI